MPKINLLPLKAARRVGNARNQLIAFAMVVGGVMFGLYIWYMAMQARIGGTQAHIVALNAEIASIDKVVARVEEFKKKSATLERKLDVIDTLKRQKVGPAKMLSDLSEIMTRQRKVWLTSLEERDGLMTMKGGAMEQENISEFQMALESQSKFFGNIKLTLVNSATENSTAYFQWAITCRANYAAG